MLSDIKNNRKWGHIMLIEDKQALPFSHFIGNKDIINNLKIELLQLRGYRYSCKDIELQYIDIEIKKVENTIRYNVSLSI